MKKIFFLLFIIVSVKGFACLRYYDFYTNRFSYSDSLIKELKIKKIYSKTTVDSFDSQGRLILSSKKGEYGSYKIKYSYDYNTRYIKVTKPQKGKDFKGQMFFFLAERTIGDSVYQYDTIISDFYERDSFIKTKWHHNIDTFYFNCFQKKYYKYPEEYYIETGNRVGRNEKLNIDTLIMSNSEREICYYNDSNQLIKKTTFEGGCAISIFNHYYNYEDNGKKVTETIYPFCFYDNDSTNCKIKSKIITLYNNAQQSIMKEVIKYPEPLNIQNIITTKYYKDWILVEEKKNESGFKYYASYKIDFYP